MLQRLEGTELQDAQDRTTVDSSRPALVGYGPVEFATTLALEPWPSIIWDASCFYWHMGVARKASRQEIRAAYQSSAGEGSVRLTMIAAVLINPVRRLRYDCVPLGSLFVDDQIENAMRIQAASEASGVRADGGEVDSEALNQQIEELKQQIADELPPFEDRYPWSYYLQNSTCDDTERLDEWRTAILSMLWAYRDCPVPERLAIGYSCQSGVSFRFAKVGFRMLLLIDDHLGFSVAEAAKAAQAIVNYKLTPEKCKEHLNA